jgi:hypothetical protein
MEVRMAFQQVPKTIEVRCINDFGDQEFITTFYARCLTGYNNGDIEDVHVAVGEAWRDSMMTHLCSVVTFDRTEVRDLDEEFGYSSAIEYNTAGTQGTAAAPPQVALLIKLAGDAGGAPRQGHHFISGLQMSQYSLDDNVWSDSIVAAVVDAENDITGAIASAGTLLDFARVIVSRTHNKELRTPAVTNTLATITGSIQPASQRDRRQGVGS